MFKFRRWNVKCYQKHRSNQLHSNCVNITDTTLKRSLNFANQNSSTWVKSRNWIVDKFHECIFQASIPPTVVPPFFWLRRTRLCYCIARFLTGIRFFDYLSSNISCAFTVVAMIIDYHKLFRWINDESLVLLKISLKYFILKCALHDSFEIL